jgi:thiol-disulfide isomerase/thioredoxin
MVNVEFNSPADDVSVKSKQIKQGLKGRAVVLIWATWCPHCTSMKPAWDKTKNNLSKEGISFIEIESVNVERLDNGLKQRVIVGQHVYFPMIRTFKGSKSDEYSGERDAATLTKELSKKLGDKPKSKPASGKKGTKAAAKGVKTVAKSS